MVEERISALQDKSIEIIQPKEVRKNKQSLRDLWEYQAFQHTYNKSQKKRRD